MKILVAIFVLFCSIFAGATACPTGYTSLYALPVLAQAAISGDLTSFPVGPFLGNAVFKTVANGGLSQSTGIDLVPCDAATGGNIIPYELVAGTYVASTGAGEWYFLLPTYSHTSTVLVYWMIGKASASDLSTPASVWPNYLGVWHGGANDNSLHLTDSKGVSTSPTNHSLINNIGVGFINGAFQSSGQWFDSNNILAATAYTVEGWGNFTSFAGSRIHGFASNNTSTAGFNFYAFQGGLSIGTGGVGADSVCRFTGSVVPINVWTHMVGVFAGGNASLAASYASYVNGVAQTCTMAATGTTAMVTPTAHMILVDVGTASTLGVEDEIRISSVARSADWIKASYLLQNSPASAYGIMIPFIVGPPYFNVVTAN